MSAVSCTLHVARCILHLCTRCKFLEDARARSGAGGGLLGDGFAATAGNLDASAMTAAADAGIATTPYPPRSAASSSFQSSPFGKRGDGTDSVGLGGISTMDDDEKAEGELPSMAKTPSSAGRSTRTYSELVDEMVDA